MIARFTSSLQASLAVARSAMVVGILFIVWVAGGAMSDAPFVTANANADLDASARSPQSVSHSATFPTSARAGIPDFGVGFIIRMSVRAMRTDAQVLSCISPANILSVRNRLQMVRVYAASHSAEMIKFQPLRDNHAGHFVRVNMSRQCSVVQIEAPVSTACRTHPNPASAFRHRKNVAFEACCIRGKSDRKLIAHLLNYSIGENNA